MLLYQRAHTLDNRRAISGLKFQSFVRLGLESYNDHIEPYLKSKGNKRANQILKQISLHDLLFYCATDSLLEWLIAQIQMKELKYGPFKVETPVHTK